MPYPYVFWVKIKSRFREIIRIYKLLAYHSPQKKVNLKTFVKGIMNMDKTHVCLNKIKRHTTNPYKVDCGGLTISLSFEGTDTLENKILDYLKKT